MDRTILTQKNIDTLNLNNEILEKLDTDEITYYRADCIINDVTGRFTKYPLITCISSLLPVYLLMN